MASAMRHSRAYPYLLLTPALAVFGFWVIYPILHTCLLSGYTWTALHPHKEPVGLLNYARLLSDPVFYISLRNNGYFILLSLAIQLPLALALAVWVGSALRRHQIIRTFLFSPFVLPIVAVGLIWTLICEPNFGALNGLITGLWEVLGRLGLQVGAAPRPGWLGNPPELAIFTIIGVSCWRFTGFHMMILLAGLQAIPDEYYEAARIDGAGRWQRYITLPLLRRVMLVDALLIAVGSVKIFDLIYVMTGGGPNHASEVLATYMYRLAFTDDRMGYSAAVAVVMLLLTLAFTAVYLRLSREQQAEAA